MTSHIEEQLTQALALKGFIREIFGMSFVQDLIAAQVKEILAAQSKDSLTLPTTHAVAEFMEREMTKHLESSKFIDRVIDFIEPANVATYVSPYAIAKEVDNAEIVHYLDYKKLAAALIQDRK